MYDLHNLVFIQLQNGNGFQNTTCTTEIEYLIKLSFLFSNILWLNNSLFKNESEKLNHELNSEQRASRSKHLGQIQTLCIQRVQLAWIHSKMNYSCKSFKIFPLNNYCSVTLKYFIHIRGGLLKCLGHREAMLHKRNKENNICPKHCVTDNYHF